MVAVVFSMHIAAAGQELDWLGERSWLVLLFLIAFAAIAIGYSKRALRVRNAKPRGHKRVSQAARDFDLEIAKLDARPRETIAAARLGPTHLRGKIIAASGKIGGRQGFERIWYNLVGAPKESAAAVEWCVLQDESGTALLVNIGNARIIAPYEEDSRKVPAMTLRINDEVEVLGILEPPGDLSIYADPEADPKAGPEADPESRSVLESNSTTSVHTHAPYGGLLGASRPIQFKVVGRPLAQDSSEPSSAPDGV
jgi:hypothetical protein